MLPVQMKRMYFTVDGNERQKFDIISEKHQVNGTGKINVFPKPSEKQDDLARILLLPGKFAVPASNQDLRLLQPGSTVRCLQSHILPSEDLAGIYRFAVLLTGAPESAQAIVLETFADAGEKIHHFRNGKSCKAWLVAKLRNRQLRNGESPPSATQSLGLNPQALGLAGRFVRIPEPGRSALALLYLDQFSPQEIAQILQINMDELSTAVDSARSFLQEMETAQRPTLPAEEQTS